MKKILQLSSSIIITLLLTGSAIHAWSGLVASDGDLLTFTKWNELLNYIDTTFLNSGTNIGLGEGIFKQVSSSGEAEFKSLVAGTGVTLISTTNEVLITSAGGSTNLTSETLTVPSLTCGVSTIPAAGFLNAFANSFVTVTPSVEIFASGTIDPDNSSTADANIRNNDYTDLIYNNSSAGSANKSLPAIDLGAVLPLGAVRMYWWSPASYGVTNGKIQGSVNGTTWTDLVTGIVKTSGATGDFDDYTVTGSYRYVRFFSVTGVNATWFTMSEIEAFGAATSTTGDVSIENIDVITQKNGGFIEFCNNEVASLTIEVNGIQ
ncbi:discoidin domain-containing protein [Candidatus Gracilibacteria bacterium]|nr:discoidin domain-containing protein [Candidatus Gracilibacteria bacterium]